MPSAAATLTVSPGPASQFSFNISGISGYQYVVQACDESGGLGSRADQHRAVHLHGDEYRESATVLLPDILLSTINRMRRPAKMTQGFRRAGKRAIPSGTHSASICRAPQKTHTELQKRGRDFSPPAIQCK